MKSVKIIYFGHGTTTDNENGIATGWNQGELSELGIKQSKELWDRVKDRKIDIVICSDLKRAVDSAEYCFKGKVEINIDKRLRECNYGDLNGAKSEIVRSMMIKCIDSPFPNGESYKDVEKRIRSFLDDVLNKYPEGSIGVFSHLAPQLAIEVITKGKPWKQIFKDYWREKRPKGLLPGWVYRYEKQCATPHGFCAGPSRGLHFFSKNLAIPGQLKVLL